MATFPPVRITAQEVGATVELFVAGTSTPAEVYADSSLAVSLGDTITAALVGTQALFPAFFPDPAVSYKVVFKAASGAELFTVDDAIAATVADDTNIRGNLILNSDFASNTGSYAGGALTSGQEGHDLWFAGSSGATYTVTAGAATLTAGSLVQTLKGSDIEGGYAGQQITASINVTATPVTISLNGVDEEYTTTGRKTKTFIVPTGTTGDIDFEISGSGTWDEPKLEIGSTATAYTPVGAQDLVSLLVRDKATMIDAAFLGTTVDVSGVNIAASDSFALLAFKAVDTLPTTVSGASTELGGKSGLILQRSTELPA